MREAEKTQSRADESSLNGAPPPPQGLSDKRLLPGVTAPITRESRDAMTLTNTPQKNNLVSA